MFSEATSGLNVAAGLRRSSIDIVGAPPVVMLMTAFELCLMFFRKGAKASGLWSGRPSFGSRACRCTTAAPASAAPIAASAISLAVTGIAGDIDGVWMEPVTAQVMITLFFLAIVPPRVLFVVGGEFRRPGAGVERAKAQSRYARPSVRAAATWCCADCCEKQQKTTRVIGDKFDDVTVCRAMRAARSAGKP